jgi:hypothetical protein
VVASVLAERARSESARSMRAMEANHSIPSGCFQILGGESRGGVQWPVSLLAQRAVADDHRWTRAGELDHRILLMNWWVLLQDR